MLISKGNSPEWEILGTNRGILAKAHSIFYKKKLVCYANAFYLANADLVRHKVFTLLFLVLHQLKQGMLYIERFLIYFENFWFIIQNITIAKIRSNKRFVYSESLLIRPIIY